MCVCSYIHVHTHTHIYIYMYVYIYIYRCRNIYHIHVHICVHIYTYIHDIKHWKDQLQQLAEDPSTQIARVFTNKAMWILQRQRKNARFVNGDNGVVGCVFFPWGNCGHHLATYSSTPNLWTRIGWYLSKLALPPKKGDHPARSMK